MDDMMLGFCFLNCMCGIALTTLFGKRIGAAAAENISRNLTFFV